MSWSLQHPEGWKVSFGDAFEVGVQGRFEGGEAELVGAESACEGVLAHRGDPKRCPHRDPCLRPAEQLVAGEDREVRPVSDDLLHPRLVANGKQCSTAYVGDDRLTEGGEIRDP